MLWRPAGHAHMFRLSRQVALALLGLLYFVISLCNAATVTWIAGTQSLDYHSPVNWDSGNVPTNSDDVVIGSGASVRVNQPVNVTSLRITGGATVALAAQMVFSSGVLVESQATLRIANTLLRTFTAPSPAPNSGLGANTATVNLNYPTITIAGRIELLDGAISGMPANAPSIVIKVNSGGTLATLGSSQGSSLLYAKLAVGGIFQVAGPPAGQAPSLPSVYSSGTTEIGIDNGGQMLVQGSDYNADSTGLIINNGLLVIDGQGVTPGPDVTQNIRVAVTNGQGATLRVLTNTNQAFSSPKHTVNIFAPFTNFGTIELQEGVVFTLKSTLHNFDSTSTTKLANGAEILCEAGKTTIMGVVNSASSPTGTLHVKGNVVVGGSVYVNTLLLQQNSQLTLGVQNLSTTTVNGAAAAPAKLSVFKLMTWVGGSISCEGPLATSGTLTLESGVELTITRDGGVKVLRTCTFESKTVHFIMDEGSQLRLENNAKVALRSGSTTSVLANTLLDSDASISNSLIIDNGATLIVTPSSTKSAVFNVPILSEGNVLIRGADASLVPQASFAESDGTVVQMNKGASLRAVGMLPTESRALLRFGCADPNTVVTLPSTLASQGLDMYISKCSASSRSSTAIQMRGLQVADSGKLNIPTNAFVYTTGPTVVGTYQTTGTITGDGTLNVNALRMWGGTLRTTSSVIIGTGGMQLLSPSTPMRIGARAIDIASNSVSVAYPGTATQVISEESVWKFNPGATFYVAPGANITLQLPPGAPLNPLLRQIWLNRATLSLGLPATFDTVLANRPPRIEMYIRSSGALMRVAPGITADLVGGFMSEDGVGDPKADSVINIGDGATLRTASASGLLNSYGAIIGSGNLVTGTGDHAVSNDVNVTTLRVTSGGTAWLARGCKAFKPLDGSATTTTNNSSGSTGTNSGGAGSGTGSGTGGGSGIIDSGSGTGGDLPATPPEINLNPSGSGPSTNLIPVPVPMPTSSTPTTTDNRPSAIMDRSDCDDGMLWGTKVRTVAYVLLALTLLFGTTTMLLAIALHRAKKQPPAPRRPPRHAQMPSTGAASSHA